MDELLERYKQLIYEDDETYNLSVEKILKRASREISGEFEIEMREFFEIRAENTLVQMNDASYIPPELLRQYLLAEAKVAVIDFILKPQTQATLRSYHQKHMRLCNQRKT